MLPRNIFQGYDRYLPYILENKYDIFGYTGCVPVFFENCSAFRETIQSTREDYIRICQTIQENVGILGKSYEIMMTPDQAEWLCEKKSYNITYLDEFLTQRDQCEWIPCFVPKHRAVCGKSPADAEFYAGACLKRVQNNPCNGKRGEEGQASGAAKGRQAARRDRAPCVSLRIVRRLYLRRHMLCNS